MLKRGEITTKEIVEIVLGAAAVLVLIFLMYGLLIGSFDVEEETAKSYGAGLKDAFEKAATFGRSSYLLWGGEPKMVYFGDKFRVVIGEDVFFEADVGKNRICFCYETKPSSKDWKCTGCMKLDKPVNFRKASATVLGEDAIDHIYFFKGDEYWKYDNYHGEVLGDYPAQIWDERSGGWKGLPDDLDAAVKYTETSFFFFKDKNYWRYDWDGSNDINGIGSSGTIKDGWKGIEGPLDAAVKGLGDDFFLFQGDKYWWYEYSKTTNNRRSPVDGDKIAGNWDTIPAGFKPTAAVRFRDYVYLFNETKYYKFDLQANKVVKDYPRDMILWGDDFLGLDAALQGQETSIRYEAYDKLLVFEEGCKFDIVSNPNSYVVEVNCNYISNAN